MFLGFGRIKKSEYWRIKKWMDEDKEENWPNEKLFGFSAVYTNNSVNQNIKIFDIWTPNTWHSFCVLIKDNEGTLFLDRKQIARNQVQFEVPQ